MDIYLLRHGIAEDAAPGGRDSERALTAEGKEKLRRVLKRARAAGVSPSLILSSPYRRALETAKIAAEELRYERDIVTIESLVPNSRPSDTWSDLRPYTSEDAMLLASHEPLMSALLAFLLGVPALQTDFKKGALARVDCPSTGAVPKCALKWLITPSLA